MIEHIVFLDLVPSLYFSPHRVTRPVRRSAIRVVRCEDPGILSLGDRLPWMISVFVGVVNE